MKAGETIGNVASAINGLSSAISIGISFARIGTEIFNDNVQSKIINTQLVANMTMGVGLAGKGSFDELNFNSFGDEAAPLPPIFWEEYWYPSVEAADFAYSNTFYANVSGQVFTVPGYPNVKFLLFHYEQNTYKQIENGENAGDANDHVINPNSIMLDKHEVAYKSTKEGGSNALMFPVNRGENRGHGQSLAQFYKRYQLKDGDPFLVPLYKPTLGPLPVRQFKPGYKPQIKIYDGSPFEWMLPSPAGAGALIEQLFKRLAF